MPPRPNSPSISYLPALVAVTIFLFPRCRHKTAYSAPSRRSVPGSIPLSAHCFALATGRVAAERNVWSQVLRRRRNIGEKSSRAAANRMHLVVHLNLGASGTIVRLEDVNANERQIAPLRPRCSQPFGSLPADLVCAPVGRR